MMIYGAQHELLEVDEEDEHDSDSEVSSQYGIGVGSVGV
jgi:hypothetical protein